MSAERLDKLERVVIKMESSVAVLSDKMSDVAASLSTMSAAVSKLALYDVKIERIEKDVTNIATNLRSTDKRISIMSEEHYDKCNTEIIQVQKQGINRAYQFLVGGLTIVSIAFGYIYSDMKDIENKCNKITSNISNLEKVIAVIENSIEKENK